MRPCRRFANKNVIVNGVEFRRIDADIEKHKKGRHGRIPRPLAEPTGSITMEY